MFLFTDCFSKINYLKSYFFFLLGLLKFNYAERKCGEGCWGKEVSYVEI